MATTKKGEKKESAPAKAATKKAAKDFTLELSFNGEVFKTTANTLEEALLAFVESDAFPVGFKTKLIIKCEGKKVKRQVVLNIPQARRIFNLAEHKPESLSGLAQILSDNLNA